jgi:hypothetical protein
MEEKFKMNLTVLAELPGRILLIAKEFWVVH